MSAKVHSTSGHSITQYAAEVPYKNDPFTANRRPINGRSINRRARNSDDLRIVTTQQRLIQRVILLNVWCIST